MPFHSAIAMGGLYGQKCCHYAELVAKSVAVLGVWGLLSLPTVFFLRENFEVCYRCIII